MPLTLGHTGPLMRYFGKLLFLLLLALTLWFAWQLFTERTGRTRRSEGLRGGITPVPVRSRQEFPATYEKAHPDPDRS